jgi:hypothetical protein
MLITTTEKKLSDGSLVYDVTLSLDEQSITLPAITMTDAYELSLRLRAAITDHTTILVSVA